MLDAAGNLVPHADHNVRFTIQGPGTLLAVGSSEPKTEEMYTGNQRRLFKGRALAVIRSEGAEGEIVLTAEADGVSASKLIVKSE
jgi:beta-galactosidase